MMAAAVVPQFVLRPSIMAIHHGSIHPIMALDDEWNLAEDWALLEKTADWTVKTHRETVTFWDDMISSTPPSFGIGTACSSCSSGVFRKSWL